MKLRIEDHSGKVIAIGSLIVVQRTTQHAIAKLKFQAVEAGWIQYFTALSHGSEPPWRMHALSVEGMGETYLAPEEHHAYRVVLKQPAPFMTPAGWHRRLAMLLGLGRRPAPIDCPCTDPTDS